MLFVTIISVVFFVDVVRTWEQYGDSCTTANGDNGVCTASSDCVQTDFEVQRCGYSQLVCCYKQRATTNTYSDRWRGKTRDKLDYLPSKNINSQEDYFSSSESSLLEERSRWPMRRKPTHHSNYNQGSNPYRDPVNGYDRPSSNYPIYNKPNLHRPIYNIPTENNFHFDKKDDVGWRPKPTEPRPVWDYESSEKTKTLVTRRKRISQIKCEEYTRPVTETVRALPLSLDADVVPFTVQKCDFTAAKLIIGGVAAEVGEFPHMAAVGFRSTNGKIMWNCGGSLISDQYVMTAGHCTNTTFGNPVVVRLGEQNIAEDNDEAEPEDYQVAQVILHPRYSSSVKYNDIALLRLERPIRMNEKIRPACLSSSESITDKPIASGWGRTDFVGRVSDVLMKVGLSIIDNNQCNELYKKDRSTSRSFKQGIVDSMLCAGELQGGKDTCFGDSGGPLQVVDDSNQCIYHIIGITSFGKVCGASNSPGVYTRVSKFLPWIENTVWG